MKIRSLTLFDNPGRSIEDQFLKRTSNFQEQAGDSFSNHGFEVQTLRIATPPFPTYLTDLTDRQIINFATQLEGLVLEQGYDYLSLGPALPAFPTSYQLVPDLIGSTRATFVSGKMTDPQRGVFLPAVKACGEIIQRLAPLDSAGFANLYFAALGNVPSGAPFFPAAYHQGEEPAFAVAVEAADLAVKAFQDASSFEDARARLIRDIELAGEQISQAASALETITGACYQGIDFSLAPFPVPDQSIGTALEALGIDKLGQHGSLASAAFLVDSIDRANFHRTGFSGLMLPVLEDSVLAERASAGTLTVKDLLLYSAVCGTGLDTVPLPGSCTGEEISAVLLDLAVLSLRLNKPLTARLMPIPGKKAGDPTQFDFAFFANSRVLTLDADRLSGKFQEKGYLDIQPRQE